MKPRFGWGLTTLCLSSNKAISGDFCLHSGRSSGHSSMQVLGGYGYMGEYVVERLWRDAKLLEIGGGTLESHQKNMARELHGMDF